MLQCVAELARVRFGDAELRILANSATGGVGYTETFSEAVLSRAARRSRLAWFSLTTQAQRETKIGGTMWQALSSAPRKQLAEGLALGQSVGLAAGVVDFVGRVQAETPKDRGR